MSKPIGKHKYNRLTDLRIRKLTDKGRYGDGHGLYLVVHPSEAKSWLLRIVINRKRRDITLGGYPLVTLAMARETALIMRRQAKQGLDPVAIRADAKRVVPTFEEAARKVHEANVPTWKITKAVQQWIRSLEIHAFPKIGEKSVSDIGPPDIIDVLSPIWVSNRTTADRVRRRMSRIFDWAKTQEYMTRENPVTGIKQGLPGSNNNRGGHFAAMPYPDVPAFLQHLQSSTQSVNVKLGISFLLLNGLRSKELRLAEWAFIDFDKEKMAIPAHVMKNGIEHHIPLCSHSMAILGGIKPITGGSKYIFPSSQNWTKPMSDSTLSKALRVGLGYPYTIHGFRTSFRTWISETTSYPYDVAEMAIAHKNKNKTAAAYVRGDLFKKRKQLMRDWAEYCYEA